MTTTQPGLTYAYTQTLAPRYFKLSAIEQFAKSIKIIRKVIMQTCSKAQVLPELTMKTNIHYHGILTFIDAEHMHIFNDCIRGLGFSLLKPIFNISVWETYMKKNYKETKKFLNIKILYDYCLLESKLLIETNKFLDMRMIDFCTSGIDF